MNDRSETMHRVTLQGVEVPYARMGSGQPMVLLHGGGGPVTRFPFVDELARRFEIIAPIHPGFAGTPIPEHFDDMQDLVYLHLDLLDALDLHDVVLVGFSMGGWAAAEIAVMNCRRLSKLILVDAVGIKPGGRESRDIADVFAVTLDEFKRLIWHDPAKAPDFAAMDEAQQAIFAGDRVALGLYTWQPYMHNPKLPRRLHRVTVPTLLIWGESDRLVTPEYGAAFRDMIPGATLVTIPEAGHAPYMEQPARFVEHVLSFAG